MDDQSADVGFAEPASDCEHLSPTECDTVAGRDGVGVAESDHELVLAARAGDREAFARVYERYRSMAIGVARRAGASPSDADDAVSEAFTRIYLHLQRGSGPEHRFPQYLARAVRNAVIDRHRSNKRTIPHEDMEPLAVPIPFTDTAVGRVESAMAAAAFRSLPQRWREVLWRVEIEGRTPAAVAEEFGLSPNSVSALAMRAREGLRQAYLQAHLQSEADPGCQPVIRQLGKWARAGLGKRDLSTVSTHLTSCARCQALAAELRDINTGMRGIAGIILLGGAVSGEAMAGWGSGTTTAGHGARARRAHRLHRSALRATGSGHAAIASILAAAALVAGVTAATIVAAGAHRTSPSLSARTGIAIGQSPFASTPAASTPKPTISAPKPKIIAPPAVQQPAAQGASRWVPGPSSVQPTTGPPASPAAAVFAALNDSRIRNGLAPLKWSTALAGSAAQHDLVMSAADQISHQLPGEGSLTARMQARGYPALGSYGENIAYTSDLTMTGALEVESKMLNESPPDDLHRTNILSIGYRVVGIAVYIDTLHGRLWLTEDFGS